MGNYAIITNDNHSAILNTITNVIYDPTYCAQDNENLTLKMLGREYKVIDILTHSREVDLELYNRLNGFFQIPTE